MQKIIFYFLLFTFFFNVSSAQQNNVLISGPWAGNVELRTAMIWLEVAPSVKKVSVTYAPKSDSKITKTVTYKGELGKDFNPVKIELNELEFGTTYNYDVNIDGKKRSEEHTSELQ